MKKSMGNNVTDNSEHWKKTLINEQATMGDVIRNLDESKLQISLVVSEGNHLIGTITDGDVRRGLLHGFNLKTPVTSILKSNAMVAPQHMSRDLIMQTMRANSILQMPVVDEQMKVVGLHIWNELAKQSSAKPNTMIIMAGGFGTRLRPHTENCPKPMLLVNGKPILEHIIMNAKGEGFQEFIIATHYLGHMIEDYFGDGQKWDININYIKETSPLGTSGALSLLETRPEAPFIVTNGDVLSDISYSNILEFHCFNPSVATMAVRQHELHNPFGVVQIEGLNIIGFEEKPVVRSNINAGVYVLDPDVLKYIEKETYFDMPSLFESLRRDNKPIMAYLIHEDWMDIGRSDDLEKANVEFDLKNNG